MIEALRESEGRFRAIFQEAALGIGLVDTDGRVMDSNPALQSMLGYTASELTGVHVADITHPEDVDSDLESFRHLLESRQSSYAMEKRYIGKEGSTIWARLTVSLVRDADDNPQYAIGMAEDITEQRQTEVALQESERRFRDLFENSPDAIFVQRYDGKILDVNPAACDLHGMDRDELIGLDVMETVPPEYREQARVDDARLVENPQSTYEGHSWTKDGHVVPVEIRTNHIDYQGQPALLFHVRDITDRKRFEARLTFMADHDHLTQLFNRRRFERELNEALAHAEYDGSYGALLWIDVDRFKAINDRLGYKAGDDLLIDFARMLTAHLGDDALVARMGGDEFAVLIPMAKRDEAEAMANKIREWGYNHLGSLDDELIRVTVSVGVVLFPEHGLTVADLLAHVDWATRRAKEMGGNCAHVYIIDEDRQAQSVEDLNWAARIRKALEEDRFQLYEQSVWDLEQNRSHGAELLLRMEDDDRMILPGAFLDAATRFGLMVDIDRWVIDRAMQLIASSQRLEEFSCFEINLSAKAIGDSELLEFIEAKIAYYAIEPNYITFEITETDAISNINRASEFIQRLKALGCKFALDDFGVGFSTFYHLKHLPIDYIKIDGDFIQNILHERLDQHIVRSIVQIAQAMEIQTIAEFVEDEAAYRLLKDYGVDYAQGFFIDRPQPLSRAVLSEKESPSE